MTRRMNRVALDHLQVLDAIERQGSFAAAAQELCVVTSALTHTVRNLEEQLGLTIFDRSGRRARFTSQGRALLERGRELLAHASAFDEQARLIATGWEPSLVLAIDQVIRMEPLIPLVAEFFRAAPETSLQLRRDAAAGSWDALLAGRADLVVGAPAQGPAGGGYESVPLSPVRHVLVAAPGHPLAQRKSALTTEEIAAHRAVIIGDTTQRLPPLARSLGRHRQTLSVPDADAKLQALLLGLGCGFVPERLARPHVRAGRLCLLQAPTQPLPDQGHLAWRAGEGGRALRWWIDRLTRPRTAEGLFY